MATSDVDVDALINRLSGPLEPPARVAFRAAALDALARVPCLGEGAIYRAVASLQRQFWDPPEETILSESGRGGRLSLPAARLLAPRIREPVLAPAIRFARWVGGGVLGLCAARASSRAPGGALPRDQWL